MRRDNSKPHCNIPVLIVDDDEIALEMLGAALTEFGYPVDTARNGREALEKIRWTSPRIVISDVDMPELSGVDLCRAIRKGFSTQYTYVILLTCNSQHENMLLGLDAGADEYLCKPFQPDELRLRLEAGKRVLLLEGRDMMIFSLAKLAESRDQDTGAHLERIREYCRALTTELQRREKFRQIIDGQFIDLIYLTSPLHDIGKVGIPDAVLLKPGSLTKEEFEIMKRHTTIGGDTLRASAEAYPEASFLVMALEIALKHHERWDGTGYPFGISGEEIPLAARIVAVADVYDALTTKRVYKPAFSHDDSARIIRQGAGTHFDPDIVDAFNTIESQMLAIRNCLPDGECAPSAVFPTVEVACPPLNVPVGSH